MIAWAMISSVDGQLWALETLERSTTALGWEEEEASRAGVERAPGNGSSQALLCSRPLKRAVLTLVSTDSLSLEAFLSISILELQLVASQNKQSCDIGIKAERHSISF